MESKIENELNSHEVSSIQQHNSSLYKKLFFGLVAILILTVIASGAYFIGKNQAKKAEITPTQSIVPTVYPTVEVGKQPEATPSSSVSIKDESVVPVGPNTVSFTRVGDKTYLSYRGKIYDDIDQNNLHEVNLLNSEQHTWYGLADAATGVPAGQFMLDEVFGFKVSQDKKSFAFVMRWGTKPEDISYYLYSYMPFLKYRQSILMEKFTKPTKIDQFSPDIKYLSLNMYECWNCGGHKPDTLLVRIDDNETKNVGKTSYFTWKNDGGYEYKEYKIIPCPPTPTGEWMGGACSEKPENLPLKTGQF